MESNPTGARVYSDRTAAETALNPSRTASIATQTTDSANDVEGMAAASGVRDPFPTSPRLSSSLHAQGRRSICERLRGAVSLPLRVLAQQMARERNENEERSISAAIGSSMPLRVLTADKLSWMSDSGDEACILELDFHTIRHPLVNLQHDTTTCKAV